MQADILGVFLLGLVILIEICAVEKNLEAWML